MIINVSTNHERSLRSLCLVTLFTFYIILHVFSKGCCLSCSVSLAKGFPDEVAIANLSGPRWNSTLKVDNNSVHGGLPPTFRMR